VGGVDVVAGPDEEVEWDASCGEVVPVGHLYPRFWGHVCAASPILPCRGVWVQRHAGVHGCVARMVAASRASARVVSRMMRAVFMGV